MIAVLCTAVNIRCETDPYPFVRSGIKTGSGGSFSATHNELIVSGANTGNGVNLTAFPNQTGQHDAAFYNLNEHRSDQRGNKITDSLPSGGAKSHSETCTGKSTSSSSQNRPSLLIVVRLVSLPTSLGFVLRVCLSALSECLRIRRETCV
eukprot:SAG31_NODE_2192_length_6226_cov_6.328219_9_plen_150_part_00